MNIASLFLQKARTLPCEVFMADMKLRIQAWNAFYYPDIMVCCNPEDNHPYYRERPCLVVEVLSPGTAGVDRREKLAAYQTLPSLKEYLLVEQEHQSVQIYRRNGESWALEELAAEDELQLDCIDLKIPVALLYQGIM